MSVYEEKLKEIIKEKNIKAEFLSFDHSCHSVNEAAQTVGTDPNNFVKSICMVDDSGNVIIAIVKGEDRASTSRIGKYLGISRPRIALPEEVLGLTGFPVGGTPGFGFKAKFLMDPRVLEKKVVYAGGGGDRSLVKITSMELLRASEADVVRIRK